VDDGQRAELRQAWAELAAAGDRVAWLPVAARVITLSREAGRSLPWQEVPVVLVRSGAYERLMARAGVPFGLPSWRAAELS
jgi:hypothetical protein